MKLNNHEFVNKLLRKFNSHSYGRVELISIAVFFMPIFFLTVKSWVTTSLFLLFFVCCWPVIKNPTHYFCSRGKEFWILLVCLIMPFLSELFAQIGRGEITGSSLDGPSRMILAAGIFVFLSSSNSVKIIQSLSYGSALGTISVFVSLIFFPNYYYGARAATYFVDPITLPCFVIALLGLTLFWSRKVFPGYIDLFVKVLLAFVTIYIVVESQSRSAFVALVCLLTAYLTYFFRHSLKIQIIGLVGLITGFTILYFMSGIVHHRVNESVYGVLAFLSQDVYGVQQTSSGHRIVLGLIDVYLIKISPFFGVGDRSSLPPYEELSLVIPYLSRLIYDIRVLAGSHSEFLALLVRQGLFFGSLTLCSLFFYPLYLFIWKYRKLTFVTGSPLAVVLGIVIPISASSLTIQVFNLKMTITFYAACLAIFFAYLCSHVERKSVDDPL